jgi:hypothetical protein
MVEGAADETLEQLRAVTQEGRALRLAVRVVPPSPL